MGMIGKRGLVCVGGAVLCLCPALSQGGAEDSDDVERLKPKEANGLMLDGDQEPENRDGLGAVVSFLTLPTPGGPPPADNCTIGIDQEGLPGGCFTHMSLIWLAEHQLNLCLSALRNVEVASGSCDQYAGALEVARENYNQCRRVSGGTRLKWLCPVSGGL